MKLKMIAFAALAVALIACEKEEKSTPAHVETTINADTDIYGVVTDVYGNYLQGVVVSDGYNVTTTDANGVYQLTSCEYSYQVYITVPAEYEIPMLDGLPWFWQTLSVGQERYDFTLTPLANGPETKFNLFCLADPQCKNESDVTRFRNETCPDLLKESGSYDTPSYGVVMGDIGENQISTERNSTVFPLMKAAMKESNTGVPLFQVIGNHDNSIISNSSYSIDVDIQAQRQFEGVFGPVNYSFDRGNAHIVVMDNVYFTNHNTYELGFRDDQVDWLLRDLSYVPAGKLMILCVHIPIRAQTGYKNVQAVLDLFAMKTSYLYIMSGHDHENQHVKYDDRFEHNLGSVCGAWWNGTICCDGTPAGYMVFSIDDNQIVNSYYKGTNCDRDFQIRMYHASDVFMKGYTPNYQFAYTGENEIVVNIWDSDTDWTVEVYEDGSYSGKMTGANYTDRDAWASGYLMGVLGKSSQFDTARREHYWHYALKNSNAATVEVVATDTYGNVYRQSTFTSNTSADWPVAP